MATVGWDICIREVINSIILFNAAIGSEFSYIPVCVCLCLWIFASLFHKVYVMFARCCLCAPKWGWIFTGRAYVCLFSWAFNPLPSPHFTRLVTNYHSISSFLCAFLPFFTCVCTLSVPIEWQWAARWGGPIGSQTTAASSTVSMMFYCYCPCKCIFFPCLHDSNWTSYLLTIPAFHIIPAPSSPLLPHYSLLFFTLQEHSGLFQRSTRVIRRHTRSSHTNTQRCCTMSPTADGKHQDAKKGVILEHCNVMGLMYCSCNRLFSFFPWTFWTGL